METLYIVRRNGRIVASGNFRQCILYLMNVADNTQPVCKLAQAWLIEPAPEGYVKN